MARISIVLAFLAIATIYFRVATPASDPQGNRPAERATSEYLVILAPDPSAPASAVAADIATRHGLTIARTWRLTSLERDCYVFVGPRSGTIASLNTEPTIESAHAMRMFEVSGRKLEAPDPYVNLQHSLVSARIDEAHQLSTGKGVKVGIIDTGLDRSHYDLRERVEATLNFVDADQTIEIVEFHATAVAGILGAAARNGRGIIGIAPDSKMYSLRACWESLPGTSRGQCSSFALARAIDWAISNELKVLNMSLQGEYDPLVSRLITRAIENGLIVVAATELGDPDLSFPASMSEVIAASFHDPYRTPNYTRNAGKVFIAPGEEILTTMPDNTYDFVSGSSFASAHISGLVALLAEHVPDIDAHTVKAVLRSSTRVANWAVVTDACTALGTVVTGTDNCRPPLP